MNLSELISMFRVREPSRESLDALKDATSQRLYILLWYLAQCIVSYLMLEKSRLFWEFLAREMISP